MKKQLILFLLLFSINAYATTDDGDDDHCRGLFGKMDIEATPSPEEISRHLKKKAEFKEEGVRRMKANKEKNVVPFKKETNVVPFKKETNTPKKKNIKSKLFFSDLKTPSDLRPLKKKQRMPGKKLRVTGEENLLQVKNGILLKFLKLVRVERGNRDHKKIESLVKKNKFLKTHYFNPVDFYSKSHTLDPAGINPQADIFGEYVKEFEHPIDERHRHWFPNGVTAFQWFTYQKDIPMLRLLFDIGFEYKGKRKPGGEFTEYNPLHVAIKLGDVSMVKFILTYVLSNVKYLPEKKRKQRHSFIDEKTYDKKTTWLLALEIWKETEGERNVEKHMYKKTRHERATEILRTLSSYRPSVHVKSYYNGQSLSNYDVTQIIAAGNQEILALRDRMIGDIEKLKHYNAVDREKREQYGFETGLKKPKNPKMNEPKPIEE